MISSPITDQYPSRDVTEPRIIDRIDPVVYGASDNGPLTAQQLGQYEEQGFLVLEDYIDRDQIEALNDGLQQMCDDEELCSRDECIREPDSRAVRSFFAVHELSPLFRQQVASNQFADIARHILGGEVTVHQSRINLKPGFQGKPFPWHSDFETWHVEDGMPRMRALSMSLCLTDNFAYNGPLMLITGSHKRFVVCVGETPKRHYKESLRKQAYGVPDNSSLTRLCQNAGGIAMPAPKAGSLIVFDCNTMHGSAGNLTPYPRTNLFFVYNHVDNALVEPFSGQAPRPTYIASRPAVPICDW